MSLKWCRTNSRKVIFGLFIVSVFLTLGLGPFKGKNLNRVGYYVFIGKGDYKDEFEPKTPYFSLADWKSLIDYIKSKGATTFIPLVTGHRLPYPSQNFPKYIETEANTAKDVDLQLIIDYAKKSQLEVILAFTTTGHCNSYAQDHPEHCIMNEEGRPTNALCPNREGSQHYPLGIVEEVLKRYKNFDGMLIHPPETHPECFCPECKRLYKQKTGTDYLEASPRDRQRFFIQTFFQFARELFAQVDEHVPLRVKLMFSCNWMDDHLDLMELLPKDLGIIYWDYNIGDDYLQGQFQENLQRYIKLSRPIWYMPSTIKRWWTPNDVDLKWGCNQVVKQIQIAKSYKIENVGFFVGAYIQKESIEMISSAMNK
jgi:hypothetical protein